uniref:Lymphocyte antigen 9 n=1 Tax=Jaculus jaculus TaxID=51337 RepID=A0A8C5JXU5_JACJA
MAGFKSRSSDQALQPSSDKLQPRVFSSLLWTPLLFLLMGVGASEKDLAPRVVQGILGGSVTLPLNISRDTEVEEVVWSSSKEVLVLVRPNDDIHILAKSYKGRLNIQWSYSLYLSNLGQEDAGSYKAQINRKNSNTSHQEFTLQIYEQLQEPQVAIKSMNISVNSSCIITLSCTVKGATNGVQYSWTQKDTQSSEPHGGPLFTVSQRLCDSDLPYTCTVRNPISQSSSRPIHAWKFCIGAYGRKTMGETMVGTLGESFTLPLALSASQYVKNVVWMFNTSVISNKWEEAVTADPPITHKSPKDNRNWVSGQDYSLKISRLEMEDAGTYHAYVCSEASEVTSVRHITLLIYKRLKKPTVVPSPMHTKDGSCEINLTCSVDDGGNNVTYTWTPVQKGAVMIQRGPHLKVSWKSGDSHPNFTCTANNPVSNSSSQFLSWTICSGPEWNKSLWIGLLLAISILLLLGICAVSIWKQKRQWRFLRSASTTDHTIYTSVSQRYEKLNTPPKTTRHWSRPATDTSSDSNATTEEEDERTELPSAVNGRDEVYGLGAQGNSAYDLAFRGQAEYDVTPDDTVVKSEVERDLNYVQVILNFHGNSPAPQKKESSNTIYSSVQKPRTVRKFSLSQIPKSEKLVSKSKSP